MSCNTSLWSGDDVFSGYECILGDSLETGQKKNLNLDFDGAYQYSMAKYHGLKVVTMDKDFERIRDVEILFL